MLRQCGAEQHRVSVSNALRERCGTRLTIAHGALSDFTGDTINRMTGREGSVFQLVDCLQCRTPRTVRKKRETKEWAICLLSFGRSGCIDANTAHPRIHFFGTGYRPWCSLFTDTCAVPTNGCLQQISRLRCLSV